MAVKRRYREAKSRSGSVVQKVVQVMFEFKQLVRADDLRFLFFGTTNERGASRVARLEARSIVSYQNVSRPSTWLCAQLSSIVLA
jgi:hypothetical protein